MRKAESECFKKFLKTGGIMQLEWMFQKCLWNIQNSFFKKKTADHECFIERLQFVSGTVTGVAAQQHTVQQHSHRCSSTLTLSRSEQLDQHSTNTTPTLGPAGPTPTLGPTTASSSPPQSVHQLLHLRSPHPSTLLHYISFEIWVVKYDIWSI